MTDYITVTKCQGTGWGPVWHAALYIGRKPPVGVAHWSDRVLVETISPHAKTKAACRARAKALAPNARFA